MKSARGAENSQRGPVLVMPPSHADWIQSDELAAERRRKKIGKRLRFVTCNSSSRNRPVFKLTRVGGQKLHKQSSSTSCNSQLMLENMQAPITRQLHMRELWEFGQLPEQTVIKRLSNSHTRCDGTDQIPCPIAFGSGRGRPRD